MAKRKGMSKAEMATELTKAIRRYERGEKLLMEAAGEIHGQAALIQGLRMYLTTTTMALIAYTDQKELYFELDDISDNYNLNELGVVLGDEKQSVTLTIKERVYATADNQSEPSDEKEQSADTVEPQN